MVLYFLKGDIIRSGGLATNIGIHFFDMLNWIFGPYNSISNIECSSKFNSSKNKAMLIGFNRQRIINIKDSDQKL